MKELIWEGGMNGILKLHAALKLTVHNFSLLFLSEQPYFYWNSLPGNYILPVIS